MVFNKTVLDSDPKIKDWVTVKRSWIERLFSWPWRPWVKEKQVYSPKMYRLSGDTLVMSPDSLNYIRDQIEEQRISVNNAEEREVMSILRGRGE